MKRYFINKWEAFDDKQKLGVYANIMLLVFIIGVFTKVPYKGKEYDIVLYLSLIVYGFLLYKFFNLFKSFLRQKICWGVGPIIMILLCLGIVVSDIVYLSTPKLTMEQKIEQIINSQ